MLAGCVTPKEPEVGQIDIRVPAMYRHGVGSIIDAPSDYKRYLYNFRNAYWQCVQNYAENINYISKPGDYIGNGWPSEVDGYYDGYKAAEKDVRRNIKEFGKDRTAKYLYKVWQVDD